MNASAEQKKIIEELRRHYQLKGIKTFRGMEDQGFNTHLYKDGRPLCKVEYYGDGGPLWFSDWKIQTQLNEELKAVGCIDYDGIELNYDSELFIQEILADAIIERDFKRQCKKNTLYRLKQNKEGEYMLIKQGFTPYLKSKLQERHGDNLVEIINERYM